MKSWMFRFITGLAFALPLVLVSVAFAQSSAPPAAETTPAPPPPCQDCHADFQKAWEGGAHARANTDPNFKSAWEAQGKPTQCLACHTTGFDTATGTFHAEGVTCQACHDPVSANHPLSPASMSRSASLCGKCHTDTYFQWQTSKHGQSDLTCVSCHDPHATDIRAKDASTLCASCHGTRVAAFAHSNHAAQGLSCTDCHIGEAKGQPGMGHGTHNHTFAVNLDTCNKCHESELHSPAAAMLVAADTPAPPDSMSSGGPAVVSAEPKPVSPLGYALFTGLIGVACGMLLAPWLEHGYRRLKGEAPMPAGDRARR